MIVLPFIFALLNRLAGAGVGKWWSGKVFIGLLYAPIVYAFTLDYKLALTAAIGMLIYRSVGWGDYWDGTQKLNKEVAVIDYIIHDVFNVESGKFNDFLSMTLRGLLVTPMFIALSFFANPYSALFSFFGALQGIVYFGAGKLFGEAKRSEIAEPIMGLLIGTGFYLAVTL